MRDVVDLVEALHAEAEDALGRSAHFEEQGNISRAAIEHQVAYGLFLTAAQLVALHPDEFVQDE